MYDDDTPVGERRAHALSLNRDLLRELLGHDELRELIDAGALAALEEDLQGLSAGRRPVAPTDFTTCCGASATWRPARCRRACAPPPTRRR